MCGTRACAARALLGLFAGAVAVAVTLDNGLHTWQDWDERRRQILSFDFGITFVRRRGTSTSTGVGKQRALWPGRVQALLHQLQHQRVCTCILHL